MKVGEIMDQMEFYLSNPPCLAVPVSDADKLLGCKDLLCLKLYLYLLRSGKSVSLQRISEDLGVPQADLQKAARELKAMGLMSTSRPGKLPPADTIPEYEKAYVAKRTMEDKHFQALQEEAAYILGHGLSAQELNTLFGIYDHLGLPAEVICMLLVACVEDIQERYGPGRLPTIRQIEKEAYHWANQEIMTMELAEEHLARRAARKDKVQVIKRALGIWDRALTNTELGYFNSWLEKGFDIDAITLAYDRTVANTGSMKPQYMNRIIESWHKQGLHTVEEILAGDSFEGGKSRPKPQNTQPAITPAGEKERLLKLFGDLSK